MRRGSRRGIICWSREELVSLVDEESEDELDRGEASGGVWLVGLHRGNEGIPRKKGRWRRDGTRGLGFRVSFVYK